MKLEFIGKLNYKINYNNIILKKYNKFEKPEKYKNKLLYLDQSINSILDYIPYIKGIILKEGGILSHVAIVTRELKVPSIIGIDSDLDSFFKDEINVSVKDNKLKIIKNVLK